MMSALAILVAMLMTAAAVTDIRARRIPNLICIAVAVLALARMLLEVGGLGDMPFGITDMAVDLTVGFAVLVVTAVLFGMGIIGGGDAKLLAVGTLFVGSARSLDFLLAVSLSGLVLALMFLGARMTARGDATGPRAFDKLPYGVAIASGCVYVLAVGN